MSNNFVNHLIGFFQKDTQLKSGYKHLLFEIKHTQVAEFFTLALKKHANFQAITIGQWGDCSIPSSIEFSSATEMQLFVNKYFEQIKKYGGVNTLIFERSNPGLVAIPTYQNDIAVFVAHDFLDVIQNFDASLEFYSLN